MPFGKHLLAISLSSGKQAIYLPVIVRLTKLCLDWSEGLLQEVFSSFRLVLFTNI